MLEDILSASNMRQAYKQVISNKGFGFRYKKGGCVPRVSERPKERLKDKIRVITKRSRGISIRQMLEELNTAIRRWVNYFRIAGCRTFLEKVDGWIRVRLRTFIMEAVAVHPYPHQKAKAVQHPRMGCSDGSQNS